MITDPARRFENLEIEPVLSREELLKREFYPVFRKGDEYMVKKSPLIIYKREEETLDHMHDMFRFHVSGRLEKDMEVEESLREIYSAVTGRKPDELELDEPLINQLVNVPILQRLVSLRFRRRKFSARELYKRILRNVFYEHDLHGALTRGNYSAIELRNHRLRELRLPRQIIDYVTKHGSSYKTIEQYLQEEAETHYRALGA